MKAHTPQRLTKAQQQALRNHVDRQILQGIQKAQWLMLVAFNDALGIGRERIARVFERYETLLEEYEGYQRDDVADELLRRRVSQILGEELVSLYREE